MNDAPPELSTFVGRVEELARLGDLVAAGRVLTLVGPGGCGKTRLALRLADRHSGATCWVGLDDLTHPGDVPDRVAEALEVAMAGGTDATVALVRDLRRRDLLLVLDTCEQVLDGVAALVAAVVGACRGVAVVATSRSPLEVPGEQIFRVPPLALPDALALFLERAGLATADAGARRVCDRLDRLPLALELAAAWTATLTPEQIAESLADPYALLDRGPRTAPFRQRTLEESMRWSLDLLGDDEKALFRRLAVFEGFDAGAPSTVLALPAARLLKALRGLVSASLVVADTTGPAARYRMLETVRAYALARLADADETAAARDAHLAAQLAAVAEAAALLHTDRDAWRATIGARYPNIRAAIEWGLSRQDPTPGRRLAAGVAWLWHLGQRGHEGMRLLRRAVALGRDERTALQAECLVALALVADTTEPGPQEYATAHAARVLADEVGAAATSRLARSLAAVGQLGTDPDRARDEASLARAQAIEAGDTFVASASACLIGLIHLVRDEHRAAIDLLAPATAALLAMGERGVASSGLAWLAVATANAGDVRAAVRIAERAVQTAAPLRELHRTGLARAALAEILVLAGRTPEAAAALAPLDTLAGDESAHTTDEAPRGTDEAPRGTDEALRGMDGQAPRGTDEAPRAARTDDDGPVFVPARERAHALVALAAGRPDEALDWLRRERRWLPDGADRLVPASRLLLARALRRTGDAATAAEVLDELLATVADLPSVRAAALDEQALLAPDEERAHALRHEALRIRAAHDLTLGCIDSLEAIARSVDHDPRRGARSDAEGPPAEVLRADILLSAAARARASTGYGQTPANPPDPAAPATPTTPHPLTPAPPDPLATVTSDPPEPATSNPLTPTPPDVMELADAVALAQRARGPRGRPASGWASLTPTERSVVDLAAQGLTNPDIAARLFIGRGTVKTHLAHVYAKLGVANRTDLARLAAHRASTQAS